MHILWSAPIKTISWKKNFISPKLIFPPNLQCLQKRIRTTNPVIFITIFCLFQKLTSWTWKCIFQSKHTIKLPKNSQPYWLLSDIYVLQFVRHRYKHIFLVLICLILKKNMPLISTSLLVIVILPIATHFSVVWSVVCLSHSCTLFKPFNGITCHLTGTHAGSNDVCPWLHRGRGDLGGETRQPEVTLAYLWFTRGQH